MARQNSGKGPGKKAGQTKLPDFKKQSDLVATPAAASRAPTSTSSSSGASTTASTSASTSASSASSAPSSIFAAGPNVASIFKVGKQGLEAKKSGAASSSSSSSAAGAAANPLKRASDEATSSSSPTKQAKVAASGSKQQQAVAGGSKDKGTADGSKGKNAASGSKTKAVTGSKDSKGKGKAKAKEEEYILTEPEDEEGEEPGPQPSAALVLQKLSVETFKSKAAKTDAPGTLILGNLHYHGLNRAQLTTAIATAEKAKKVFLYFNLGEATRPAYLLIEWSYTSFDPVKLLAGHIPLLVSDTARQTELLNKTGVYNTLLGAMHQAQDEYAIKNGVSTALLQSQSASY